MAYFIFQRLSLILEPLYFSYYIWLNHLGNNLLSLDLIKIKFINFFFKMKLNRPFALVDHVINFR